MAAICSQSEIPGFAIDAPVVALTARQKVALEYLGAAQPVTSDELGAWLHGFRRDEGAGRGHGRDERCEFCSSEGAQMGRRLRTLGRVRWRRGAGWVLAGYSTAVAPSESAGYDPATAEIPF